MKLPHQFGPAGSPRRQAITAAGIFAIVWLMSGKFDAAAILAASAFASQSESWRQFANRFRRQRYARTSYDPYDFTTAENFDDLPRYAEREAPAAMDNDSSVPAQPARVTAPEPKIQFSTVKLPPKKPVELPRHRP